MSAAVNKMLEMYFVSAVLILIRAWPKTFVLFYLKERPDICQPSSLHKMHFTLMVNKFL